LKPAFKKNGVVTAANASKINDAGCALILMNEEMVKKHNLKPLARIVDFGFSAIEPIDFTIAPAKAIKQVVQKAGLKLNEIEYFELNEAFAVTALANMRLLDIDASRFNIMGGAVAMGHPVG
jgi:acetyl-CoA C-acetyltransferase